jgi:hypothetical protein
MASKALYNGQTKSPRQVPKDADIYCTECGEPMYIVEAHTRSDIDGVVPRYFRNTPTRRTAASTLTSPPRRSGHVSQVPHSTRMSVVVVSMAGLPTPTAGVDRRVSGSRLGLLAPAEPRHFAPLPAERLG